MTALPQHAPQPTGTDRDAQRANFLERAGWADAISESVAGDASTRSYERLTRGSHTAVLMNAPPAAEGAACPTDASADERTALGYNAMARLAGPNLHAFSDVSKALRSGGLSAPEILAMDADTGFALIEDLGDDLFARAIPAGANEHALYEAAVDVLAALVRSEIEPPASANYTMLTYDGTAMAAEADLLPEWYAPFREGKPFTDEQIQAYRAAFDDLLKGLNAPSTIVLRDYHAENLLWLPARKGIKRVGVIDFQDGLFGHATYDLVSLLEDARRDVSLELKSAMLDRFIAADRGANKQDEGSLRREFAILGAQRNAKILGIFARLVVRDKKPKYADLLPRVEAHFQRNLTHPALAPLKDVLADALPELIS